MSASKNAGRLAAVRAYFAFPGVIVSTLAFLAGTITLYLELAK